MLRFASCAAVGARLSASAPSAGRSVSHLSEAQSAIAAATAAAGPRKKFDPKLIYPSAAGSVRICNNTTRDAQQSNLSAEMSALHRLQIATLIDACYASTTGPPGVEQIWGGTVPMFDVWKRGAHPFDSLRAMTAMLPNTPTSMLVRSNSLNSMNSQPRDVINEFIRLSAAAGINVFTNFDANNDPRNHVAVAEAVHKAGQHYQAALSWAVYHADPTIYNVQWAVNWFRTIVRDLAPHSLYVKDPSGVLTPEMAGLLAREIKAEFPNIPLIFHTHYQTGFAYSSYLEAMKNGANGVECSIGFPDGAGQPYGLSLLRMAEEYGLDTGNPDKEAWHKVNVLCKNVLRPLYPSANVVRTPDIQVEQTGIAGGQRSILDKELIDAGQGHLIPRVDEMVQQVRKEGGLVCQVTPAADSYAREAMRRIRGGNELKGFAPGYAQILVGENGLTKEPVNESQKRAALDERVAKRLVDMVSENRISREVADVLSGANEVDPSQSPIALWRARMDELSAPVIAAQRRVEVTTRIGELESISRKPDLLASLERKIAMASRQAKEDAPEANIHSVADRVRILQAELASNTATDATKSDAATEYYHSILLGKAASSEYAIFANLSPASAALLKSGELTIAQVHELLESAGTITCSAALLLANNLPQSHRELASFDAQHILGLLDTPQKAEENTLLWACFNKAAIPNLIQNFFLHYYAADQAGFFPKLFTGDKADGRTGTLKARLAREEAKHVFLYRHIHRLVENVLKQVPGSAAIIAHVKELRHTAELLAYRQEKWSDASAESQRISDDTRAKLAAKIAALRNEASTAQEGLAQHVRAYLALNPGSIAPTYPVFANGRVQHSTNPQANDANGAATTAEVEVKMALDALDQIIHHK